MRLKILKKLLVIVLIFYFFLNPTVAFAASSCTQTNWLSPSFLYRKKIIFDNSAQAENLASFPVMIKLNSINFEFGKARSSGQDIRFTDSDGVSQLNYEIESWDSTTQQAVIWVSVPQIDASSNSDYIYMYYGNPGGNDSQNAAGVWGNYAAVWHLKETGSGTAGEYKDSTGTSNGQGGGGTESAVPTLTSSGKLNGAQTFDGGDYIFAGNGAEMLNSFTLSAWIKPQDLVTAQAIISRGGYSGTSRDYLLYLGSNKFLLQRSDGATYKTVSPSQTYSQTDIWYHVVATFNGTAGIIYVNGSSIGTANIALTIPSSSTRELNVGMLRQSTLVAFSFNGTIDEARVLSSVHSASWIAAEYKSGSDTFNSFSSEEGYRAECPAAAPSVLTCSNPSPTAPVIVSSVPGSTSVTLNYTKPSGTVTHYGVEYGTKSGVYQYGAANIGSGTTYTVNLLSPGTTYYFRVIAWNGCAASSWSSEVRATAGGYSSIPVEEVVPTPTEEPVSTPTPQPTLEPISTPKPTITPVPEPVSINLPDFRPFFNSLFNSLGSAVSSYWSGYMNLANNLASGTRQFTGSIADGAISITRLSYYANANILDRIVHFIVTAGESGIAAVRKTFEAPKELAGNLKDWISYSLTSFGEIVLDREPTRILEVYVKETTPTSAVIYWRTNHLSDSKVNFGETMDYGQYILSNEKVHEHILEIKGLKPGTKYYYEVMSQSKNYVYDAHHEFVTSEE